MIDLQKISESLKKPMKHEKEFNEAIEKLNGCLAILATSANSEELEFPHVAFTLYRICCEYEAMYSSKCI